MNKIQNILILFIIILAGCNDKRNNEKNIDNLNCQRVEDLVVDYYKSGNIILPTSRNYDNIIYFEMFKKYNIIPYTFFYPEVEDTCFQRKNFLLFMEKGLNLDKITDEMDSLNKILFLEKHTKFDKNLITPNEFLDIEFIDGVKSPSSVISRPIMKDYERYLNILKQKIEIEKDEKIMSRFWVLIDEHGTTKEVIPYLRVSKFQDSLISKMLYKSKWHPAISKIDSTAITVRMIW